jgi:hypothetical protein
MGGVLLRLGIARNRLELDRRSSRVRQSSLGVVRLMREWRVDQNQTAWYPAFPATNLAPTILPRHRSECRYRRRSPEVGYWLPS